LYFLINGVGLIARQFLASTVSVYCKKRPQTSLKERNYHNFEKKYQKEENY
jgi:hypothetical protein